MTREKMLKKELSELQIQDDREKAFVNYVGQLRKVFSSHEITDILPSPKEIRHVKKDTKRTPENVHYKKFELLSSHKFTEFRLSKYKMSVRGR